MKNKFRAFNKVTHNFDYDIEIDRNCNIQNYKFNGSAYYPKYDCDMSGKMESEGMFEIDWYVNLNDKTGKELYHMDIVSHKGLEYVIVWDDKHLCYILLHIFDYTDQRVVSNGGNGSTYKKVTANLKVNLLGNVYFNLEDGKLIG